MFEIGRVEYTTASDEEALEAARTLSKLEGILPALEPAHALAELIKRAPRMHRSEIVVVNLSGRGDKDAELIAS